MDLSNKELICKYMKKIYDRGLTTSSGGNISVLHNELIYITPAGKDKGSLVPDDISVINLDGEVVNGIKPSSEFPFHIVVYKNDKTANAVIHAHPSSCVALSILKEKVQFDIIRPLNKLMGNTGYCGYYIPGSKELAEGVKKSVLEGNSSIIMKNHGALTYGNSMQEAFSRLEILDLYANVILKSKSDKSVLNNNKKYKSYKNMNLDFDINTDNLISFIKRAYNKNLILSGFGSLSERVDVRSFIINSSSCDRGEINKRDITLINSGLFSGLLPDENAYLHELIYDKIGSLGAVIVFTSPNLMSLGVGNKKFDNKVLPESYIFLKGVEYAESCEEIVNKISVDSPCVIHKNHFAVVTGSDLFQAFDRAEVLESTSKALLLSDSYGEIELMNESQIKEIESKYF